MFNYKYYLYIFYRNDIEFYFRSKSTNKPTTKPKTPIVVYKNNLYYI